MPRMPETCAQPPRVRAPLHCLAILTAAMLAPALNVGCNDRPPSAAAESVPVSPPTSIRETTEYLRQCRDQRDYLAMRPYLDPDHRNDAISFLMVMDRLLAANEGALAAVRAACPEAPTRQLDLSPLGNYLDLFSTDLEYLDDTTAGKRGVATVQIAGRLPLEELEFERREDKWVYQPGPVSPDLIENMEDGVEALDRLTQVLHRGPMTVREIEKAYRLRIWPVVRGLTAAAEQKADPAPKSGTTTRPTTG